jgi:hypothetical protein
MTINYTEQVDQGIIGTAAGPGDAGPAGPCLSVNPPGLIQVELKVGPCAS